MTRICAICQKPPREGEEMRNIRLRTPEDFKATGIDEVSLRSSCLDCFQAHKERMVANPDLPYETVESIPNNAMM